MDSDFGDKRRLDSKSCPQGSSLSELKLHRSEWAAAVWYTFLRESIRKIKSVKSVEDKSMDTFLLVCLGQATLPSGYVFRLISGSFHEWFAMIEHLHCHFVQNKRKYIFFMFEIKNSMTATLLWKKRLDNGWMDFDKFKQMNQMLLLSRLDFHTFFFHSGLKLMTGFYP